MKTRLQIAKDIASLKRATEVTNIKAMVFVEMLKQVGAHIDVYDWSEYKDIKSANGKYAISRKEIVGQKVFIEVGSKKFEGFNSAGSKTFKSSLVNFIQNLNAIEDSEAIFEKSLEV